MKMEQVYFWTAILIAFLVFWLIPLLMPIGSLERYAFEELRVIIVGFMLGVIFMILYKRRKNI
jgi:hypothetical protein